MGKVDEEKASMAESFMNFQIELKRKEIQEFNDDVVLLEARKQKLIELRDQILQEQKGHITVLRQQAKEQQRNLEQKGEAHKEQVEEALRHNQELSRNKTRELHELNQTLRNLNDQEILTRDEMNIWQQYKNIGRHRDEEQIKKLQDELSELQSGFDEMSENIHRSLEVTFSEIDKKKFQSLDMKKNLATERAIKHLDKKSGQEVKENAWLLKEVALFKVEVSDLEEAVQKMEEENIKLSAEVQAQKLEDLQISANFFLTQSVGRESEESHTLEGTLGEFEFNMPTGEDTHGHLAVVQAAQGGGVGKEVVNRKTQATRGQTAEGYTGHGITRYRCATEDRQTARTQDINGLLYDTHTNFEDSMHLGSLAKKLLSVVGQAAPIHTVSSEMHQ
ncbi:coiled-coil domain-containing protein 83 [Engraulis encrasicolus]|uniref:coiled-coil domain-containing protein 83 n=1 Tax=Engraulis encrasicolus TaxID=184585 RepID=UPI002FD68AC9